MAILLLFFASKIIKRFFRRIRILLSNSFVGSHAFELHNNECTALKLVLRVLKLVAAVEVYQLSPYAMHNMEREELDSTHT